MPVRASLRPVKPACWLGFGPRPQGAPPGTGLNGSGGPGAASGAMATYHAGHEPPRAHAPGNLI